MSAISQVILDACRASDALRGKNDFLLAGNIPPRKAANLAGECSAAGAPVRDASFLAVIDCTVFGSCKNGLALGESGIYTHNDWTADCKSGFVPWSDFVSDGHVRKGSMMEVLFLRSGQIGVNLAGSDVGCDDCIDLFLRLREAIAPVLEGREAPAERPSAPVAPWICGWCGRSNSGVAHCQGCGAPPS